LIDNEKPDVVVLASGAKPKQPDFIDTDDPRVVNAWDVLGGSVNPVGQKVVIIGGNMMGCEVAELISEQGNIVSVIKMRPEGEMAEDCEPTNRRGLLDSLSECRVNFLIGYKVDGLSEKGVQLIQRSTGEERIVEAETIILALGAAPEQHLAKEMKKQGTHFYPIGDCRQPNNIRQAIYDGALIGRQL
jgi:pyruvate/2-oxoglutarate dehydrogenase complex dihydrolipoamide dehydrogenase (E3) component